MSDSDNRNKRGVMVVREAVGVFHDATTLETAIDRLLSAGFDRADVSLLASDDAVAEKLGHRYEKVDELEDDPAVPRAAYVDRDSVVEGQSAVVGGLAYVGAVAAAGIIVASGGSIGVAIAGAAIAGGGGGLVGGALASVLGRRRAADVERHLEHGGLLLWVRCRDDDHEGRALEILTSCGGSDVHSHDIEVDVDSERNPLVGLNVDPFLPKAPI